MTIYDITPAITEHLSVWPGDAPLTRELLSDVRRGDVCTTSSMRATVHLGAHADAPGHYIPDGLSIGECNLEPFIGRCQVIRVAADRGSCISPDALQTPVIAQRVLLATGTFPDAEHFNEDFAALSPELIQSFQQHGVVLVGVDTPSLDLLSVDNAPTHRAALEQNMAILEGLMLDDVPEGIYELIALPLKLIGFEASPVRAILRSDGSQ